MLKFWLGLWPQNFGSKSLEYLKLLNHYGVLEETQKKSMKLFQKKHKMKYIQERSDASAEEIKEVQEIMNEIKASMMNPYENRDAKVAEFKLKKLIESQLNDLRNYQDEEMKRQFYMAQIRQSVCTTFEQLRLVERELDILKHQATLTPEQIAANEKASSKPEPGSLPPLKLNTITVSHPKFTDLYSRKIC